MRSARLVLAAAFLGAVALGLVASSPEASSPDLHATLERLARAALETNGAYETIRGLTDTVGPRLAGSPGDAHAIAWAEAAG